MAHATSWDALRVFMAVVRAGSFSAAADELGLAQSSVSVRPARWAWSGALRALRLDPRALTQRCPQGRHHGRLLHPPVPKSFDTQWGTGGTKS